MRHISLGQKVKKVPTGHYQRVENRIFNIVSTYEDYVEENNVLEYLKRISYHLHM